MGPNRHVGPNKHAGPHVRRVRAAYFLPISTMLLMPSASFLASSVSPFTSTFF